MTAAAGQPQKKAGHGARSEARTAGPAAAGGSPRTVIRGESLSARPMAAIVDYLRFTFLPASSISDSVEQLCRYMRSWFPVPINFVPNEKGIFSYESSYDIMVWANGEMVRVAIIGMAGESAGNTMMLDMSGLGCSLVNDWQAVYATLQDLDARITRADTALDLLHGFTVEQFDGMYFDGKFNCGGRIPSREYFEKGDSRRRDSGGKTLYLGKLANGKELCIYEKGRQLGNADSEWVRVEVRFGNRDRVIPHDFVLDPTKYFVGAFVALEWLIDAVPEKIKTEQREVVEEEFDISLRRLLHYLRVSYGELIHTAKNLYFKGDVEAMLEAITVEGVPRRLQKAVAWKTAHDSVYPNEERMAA